MNRIIHGLDGNAPEFAGGSLGSVRRILWEVGASVLVATGLLVGVVRFVRAELRGKSRSRPVFHQP